MYKEKVIRTTVQAATEMPEWEIADATWGGIWRFNAALRYARDRSLYPYSLEVFIPSKRAGPRQHEAADPSTEEKVIAVVAGRAVLVGVRTSRDGRQFQFYTGSADWTARLQGQLRTATGSGTLTVYCSLDAHWMTYRDLRGRPKVGLKHYALALVCPTLLVPWVMVKDAYGQAWSGGEIAALAIVVAAPRMRMTRAPACLASCTSRLPTPPAAASTRTVSPGRGPAASASASAVRPSASSASASSVGSGPGTGISPRCGP